jgi:hypothetical protein
LNILLTPFFLLTKERRHMADYLAPPLLPLLLPEKDFLINGQGNLREL